MSSRVYCDVGRHPCPDELYCVSRLWCMRHNKAVDITQTTKPGHVAMVDVNWRKKIDKVHYPEAEIEVSGPVSNTLWCDIDDPETNQGAYAIGHSFPDKDVNRRHFKDEHTEAVHTGNSYGQPTYQDRQVVTSEMDICGYHWQKQNPFRPKEAPKAIETEPNEDFLKGYREGVIHGETIS